MIQMSPEQQDVRSFQWKFDVPMAPEPAFLDPQAEQFRIKFMQEELDEFKEACEAGNMQKAFDALLDLAYVLHGTALMMGLVNQWTRGWNEVQRSNMAKERATSAEQSKRGSTLDVIKPPGWTPPNHGPIVGSGPWKEFNTESRALHEHTRGVK